MILTNSQLKPLFSNCVSVRDSEEGYISATRFTDKQLQQYNSTGFIGANCDAGICFDFTYDGKVIEFEFIPIAKTSRHFMSFDLYDGDKLVYTLPTYIGAQGERKFHYEFLTKEKRRVRIFFPFSCGVEISKFTLDDGSYFAPTPTEGRKKFLILGDSITHGYDTYYTSVGYANMIINHYDAVALNQAVAGYFFNADLLDENIPFTPDVITISYGTNDWSRYGKDEEKFRRYAKAYIEKIRKMYPDAKIFGILPLWRASWNQFPDTRMEFSKAHEILTEYYTANGINIIDGRLAVPNDTHFYTDGLHPNTIGQTLYGHYVINELEKAGVTK
nr:SGNH/GDSL hydrolase family protein [Clostridia bacterium]